MRVIAAALLSGFGPALLVGGCSAEPGEAVDGDCARGVLFDGLEYVERGFVDQVDQVIGSGSYAACDDTSDDTQGLIFEDDGEKVEVWSVPDVPRQDAVAVEVHGSYAVLLNEEMGESRRAEVIAELELEG